jgi:hypothetical protein
MLYSSVRGEAALLVKGVAVLASDIVVDAANVGTATKEIIKEANNVGKTAESGVSEATEIAGIVEKLQNDLQKLIEKRTQMLNDFLEKKGIASGSE